MSIKIDRLTHGPSWKEVVLGAVLSLLLGAALGLVLLVLRPVTTVKALPQEEARDPKAVYFVEGSRDPGRARQAFAKRTAFVEGQTVAVTEEELNALVSMMATPAAGKTAEAPKSGETPPAETLATSTPNIRIQEGTLQIAVPMTVNALGLNRKMIAQARGGFEKDGDTFVFEPSEFYLGSCPLQRLPFVASWVRNRIVARQNVPDDIKAAWAKLTAVSIEGNTLTLTMP